MTHVLIVYIVFKGEVFLHGLGQLAARVRKAPKLHDAGAFLLHVLQRRHGFAGRLLVLFLRQMVPVWQYGTRSRPRKSLQSRLHSHISRGHCRLRHLGRYDEKISHTLILCWKMLICFCCWLWWRFKTALWLKIPLFLWITNCLAWLFRFCHHRMIIDHFRNRQYRWHYSQTQLAHPYLRSDLEYERKGFTHKTAWSEETKVTTTRTTATALAPQSFSLIIIETKMVSLWLKAHAPR